MSQTRRDVLRGAGLAVAAAGGASVPALAQSDTYPHYDARPEHVTLSYSEETLLAFAPRLAFSQEARAKFRDLYGWTATSPEYDYDIHVYVALYTHQTGLSPFARLLSDSHLGDTEWYYVLVDEDTGETQSVIYDAYHWVAGRQDASSITMDGQHPVAKVVDPWHFYAHGDTDADSAMAFDEIKDLTKEFGPMLSNGLAESLEPGTVTDPVTMTSRGHWWRSTVGEWSKDAALASTMYSIGWVGADSADGGVSL
jgi:hypothetical protein